MKIDQGWFTNAFEPKFYIDQIADKSQRVLILVLGNIDSSQQWFASLRATYPDSDIVSCSSHDIIEGGSVRTNAIGFTAIHFEQTPYQVTQQPLDGISSIYEAGKRLVAPLIRPDLKGVLLFSDGRNINGSEMISGVNSILDKHVIVTGGMASDGAQFASTTVGYNELPKNDQLVAVGLYGNSISIGYGSNGGWETFGPKRLVTKSSGNVLYELDGKNALELYKKYLGEMTHQLPSSALLFPLALHKEEISDYLVRTVLQVDESTSSMIFAGDIPEGSHVQLMKANFDRLIDGAAESAACGLSTLSTDNAELALLISCVGRKLVLGQRIEEEVEVCSSIFGDQTVLTGFYSHGEFSPLTNEVGCQLHNQSMTVTTFREI